MPKPTPKPTKSRSRSNVASARGLKASWRKLSGMQLTAVVALVIGLGVFVIWSVFAGSLLNNEVESWGSSGGTVAIKTDPSAANGSYIEFQAPSTPPTTGGTVTGFPTPNNTGWKPTGVTLTPYSGPSDITVAGTVIDSKDIRQCIRILAPNVTIKRSRIQCASGGPNSYALQTVDGSIIQNVEITSTALKDWSTMIDVAVGGWGNNVVLDSLYIHGMSRGIVINADSNNTMIKNNYVGDNYNPFGPAIHQETFGCFGDCHNFTITNNTFKCLANTYCSAAMFFDAKGGPSDNFTISGNLISGGSAGIFMQWDPNGTQIMNRDPSKQNKPQEPNKNFTLTNNIMNTDVYENVGEYYALFFMPYDKNLFSKPVSQGGWGVTWKNNRIKGGSYDGAFVTPWNEWLKVTTEPAY